MKKLVLLFLIISLSVFLIACKTIDEGSEEPTGSLDTEKVTEPSTIEIPEPEEETVVESDGSIGQPVPEAAANPLVEIDVIAKQWEFVPNPITVREGDLVRLNIESVDVAHGIRLPAFGISEFLAVGETVTVEFVADQKGEHPFFCSVPCGKKHSSMRGTLIVE